MDSVLSVGILAHGKGLAMYDETAMAELQAKIKRLEATNKRLHKQLKDAKNPKDGYVAAVQRANDENEGTWHH